MDPAFEGTVLRGKIGGPLQSIGTFCCELCKMAKPRDRDAVLDVDSGGSYKGSMCQTGCTLAQPGEYN